MNKTFSLYIFLALFFAAGVLAFADQPKSSLDDKPSVDTAAASGVQVPAVPSNTSAADANANYLYDLKKLIDKSRQNIKEVNEKIKEQAVLKRNQKREERAREYYEKGMELTNEGKLNEAREYFEKAIRITEHPEMAGYIKESQRRLRRQEAALHAQEREHYNQIKQDENVRKEDVEEAYREAVDLYKQKKYHPAKDAFEHVDEIAPDYRATSSYLKIIDQDIISSDALAAKQQAVEVERQQKEAEAARAKEKAMWLAQIEEKEKERKEAVDKQAEEVYDEAVDLYKKKKFALAKKKFEEVSWVIPDYKATMKYLSRIDRDAQEEQERVAEEQKKALQEQRWEEEVEKSKQEALRQRELEAKERQHKLDLQEQARFLYKAAVGLFDRKNMDEALERFKDIDKLLPGFKSTRIYIARIEQWKFDQQKEQLEAQQRAQAEAQRQKEEAQRQQELAAQRQREQELRDKTNHVDQVYGHALDLYRDHQWGASKAKFESVEQMVPDFKHTRRYLQKVDTYIARDSVKRPNVGEVASPNVIASVAKQSFNSSTPSTVPPAAVVPMAEDPLQKEQELERRRAQELKERAGQAEKVYTLALKSYRDHQWEISKAQFESVEAIEPDYKHTRRYLQKIDDFISRETHPKPPSVAVIQSLPAPEVVAAEVQPPQESMPAKVKVAISLEDQQKQAQDIAALVDKSAQLYRQIADIADDSSTIQTKRKMAQVDEILKNLKENKERLLRQMREEQWKRQREESKSKYEERRAEAEKLYQDGLEYLRSHDYAKAKIKFLELENIAPDYKSTRRYLNRVEEGLKKANVEAVTGYEQAQAEHLKQLQDKENLQKLHRVQEEQEQQHNIELQQQASLKELAQKASGINDDIIRLSKEQDYEGMKAKFTELENTVTALTTLKDEMSKAKDRRLREKQLARESARQRADMLKSQEREDRQIRAYYSVQPLKEYRPVLSIQPNDADHYRRREIMQEQNTLFSEGVDRYEHKKYTQAKLLFGELADQHDRRAEAWLKKVDRAITQQLLKSEESEERERTAFIADQLKAQRELIIIQERERQRQKRLTEELERQKRLYEDDRLLQLRKEEAMKVQERERQSQEAKRLRLERESEKQQEMLRFHKIKIVIKQPQKLQTKIVPKAQPVVPTPPAPIPAAPPALSHKQLQAQIDFSNKRKAFLDRKFKQEQQEQGRQARIKAEAEVRQKREEDRKKEKEHREELRAQREKDRQAKIKAAADARQKREEEKKKEKEHQEELRVKQENDRQMKIKAEAEARVAQAKEQAEKLAQEQKHREEVLRQQEQQREERIKQEQIMRDEARRREELERQERQRQAQLEAQRIAVRRQLEDGVETMYQDALSLYHQGEYTAAADRFRDVQDILPGYKRSEQYMDEARQKSLTVKPQEAVASTAPPSPPVSHQDNISKALDLFDPNAK